MTQKRYSVVIEIQLIGGYEFHIACLFPPIIDYLIAQDDRGLLEVFPDIVSSLPGNNNSPIETQSLMNMSSTDYFIEQDDDSHPLRTVKRLCVSLGESINNNPQVMGVLTEHYSNGYTATDAQFIGGSAVLVSLQ